MAFYYLPARHAEGHYCVSPSQMRAWEGAEIDARPGRGHELMEIAGREVAQYILATYPETEDVLVFCGPGNNGGDSLVAARYLERAGLGVHLFVFEDAVVHSKDALSMFELVRHLPRVVLREPSDISRILDWDRRRNILVIDGIFGIGYHPSHHMLMSRVIQSIAHLSCPVVSIDIPTGIDARTGYRGAIDDESPPRAIQATDTITFESPKIGHFFGDGPSYCGRLKCVDIGLNPWKATELRSLILTDDYCESHYMRDLTRQLDVHKGRCGHVIVVGGAENMTGAPCLAAMAAIRAGCGLVTLAVRQKVQAPYEIMTQVLETPEHTLDEQALTSLFSRVDCLVVGPGLGRDDLAKQIVRLCAQFKGRLVLDADALWALSEGENLEIKASECLITPHPAEAARLCHVETRKILFDPIAYAHQLCGDYGVTTILKSHATLVANLRSGHLRTGILPYPNPALATAGVGDVLAGMVGGFLAQARCGAFQRWFDTFEVASLSVYRHSLAGRRATERHGYGLCARDLLDNL